MTTASCGLPATGLSLWPLVWPLRSLLNARVPLPAKVVGIDADVLVVAVGSGTPYRLLLLHSGEDGLIRLQLWQVKKQLEVVVNERCMSDLVGPALERIAREHQLSA